MSDLAACEKCWTVYNTEVVRAACPAYVGTENGHPLRCLGWLKPLSAPSPEQSKRRMRGNPAPALPLTSRHAVEHEASPGCFKSPYCVPMDAERWCNHAGVMSKDDCVHCNPGKPTEAPKPQEAPKRWLVEETSRFESSASLQTLDGKQGFRVLREIPEAPRVVSKEEFDRAYKDFSHQAGLGEYRLGCKKFSESLGMKVEG